jgi:hypothetical protein
MLLSSMSVMAQNADEILTKHIAAMGGDSWSKIKSYKKTASMTFSGMEMEMTETKVKDKGFRTDISVMGTQNYVIITPSGGWSYMPMQGGTKAEALSAEDLKDSKDQMTISDELANYKADGLKAEYAGKEDVDGKPAHKLKLTDKGGKSNTYFIDATTYYKVRDVRKETGPTGEVELITTYTDFKKFPEGIVVAMKASNDFQSITVKDVELNKPVDEAIFKPSN